MLSSLRFNKLKTPACVVQGGSFFYRSILFFIKKRAKFTNQLPGGTTTKRNVARGVIVFAIWHRASSLSCKSREKNQLKQ